MATLPNTTITLTPPTLGTGYCPSSYQTLVDDVISGTVATFNSDIGNSFFNTGGTPSADNQVYPWFDSDGNWWTYGGGYWRRINPSPAGGSERRIWVGNTTDLLSYDGGDGTATTPSTYVGAMWEVDTAMSARFPVGVGTFAAAGTVAVTGTQTDTGSVGEDRHVLLKAELPAHTHSVTSLGNLDINAGSTRTLYGGGAEFTGSSDTGSVGDGTAHNNLPPFYGVYFIKRTARVYYTK